MKKDKQLKPSILRKPYQRPAIVYDAPLEAQAGSPLGNNPLQDLFEQQMQEAQQ